MPEMDQDKKDHKCGFCKRGRETETECGKLWHDELQKCTAHKKCMQYSANLSQYKMRRFGGFKVNKVIKEIQRGKRLKCAICSKDKKLKRIAGGATAGCAVKKCKKTFHFYCAYKDKEAITTRIEMTKAGCPSISYCVFCGDEHKSEYLKGLQCKWAAKDTDSEEENNESFSESESDKSDDDDDQSGNSSDSGSRGSSRGEKDTDRSSKDLNDKQQQQPSSSNKNGATDQLEIQDSNSNSHQSGSTVSDIFNDVTRSIPVKRPLDMSGYNISEAAQSLTQSDAGNEARSPGDGSLLHPIDATGKRLNMESAEASVKKMRMEDKDCLRPGENNTASVVCFLEKENPNLSDIKTVALILKKCAGQIFKDPPDSAFCWSYKNRPLKSGHIIYILNEISKALCAKDEDELHRLIFNLQEDVVSKFDSAVDHNEHLPDDIREELYSNIRGQIVENFEKAEQIYSKCVAKICLINQLSTYVGFVLLCRETDCAGLARDKLVESIYQWNYDLILKPYSCYEVSVQGRWRQRERDELLEFLQNISICRVQSWPKDSVLCSADKVSVTGRLYEDYSSQLNSAGAHLVFLVPVDRSILNYNLYVPKRIMAILDELLSEKHELYCVLDVGPEVGLCSLKDIVPNLDEGIELKAVVANNPELTPVSCAVLHFSISV